MKLILALCLVLGAYGCGEGRVNEPAAKLEQSKFDSAPKTDLSTTAKYIPVQSKDSAAFRVLYSMETERSVTMAVCDLKLNLLLYVTEGKGAGNSYTSYPVAIAYTDRVCRQ